MDDLQETANEVMDTLVVRGLDASAAPYEGTPWSEEAGSLIGPGSTMVTAGGQRYLCAAIADTPRLRKVVNEGGWQVADAFRRDMSWLAVVGARDKLKPTVLLDFPPGLDTQGVGEACRVLESGLDAFVLVRRPGEAADDFMARVPGLFPMSVEAWEEPDWLDRLSVEGEGRAADVAIEFGEGPGMAVLHGSNDSGKSRFVGMLRDSDIGDEVNFPSPGGYPRCADTLMRPYRRAVGYGRPDGSLLMPIQFEGEGTLRMDRVVAALSTSARAGGMSRWPGLVLDTPLSGISDLFRFKLAEVIARMALHRQVVVTSRDQQEARFLESLAHAHGAACGTGHLDFSGREVVIRMERPPEPDVLPPVPGM